MNIGAILIALIFITNLMLSITIIFLERRNVNSIWTWILILTFIPIVGFFLYIIFGRNLSKSKLFKWDQTSYHQITELVTKQVNEIDENRLAVKSVNLTDYKSFIRMQLKNNLALYSENNSVEIYTDGQKKFDSLLYDIERAKDHIHILYYIFRDDELGQRIADKLIEKAHEGVEVRFLYDDFGSRRLGKKFISSLREAGIEVKAFFPSTFLFINFSLNFRNHRKLVIIDGEIGYIGGFNVGNEYLGLNKQFGYWRDTHLKITGEAVNSIQTRFIQDWNQATREKVVMTNYLNPFTVDYGSYGIQIISSGPDSEQQQIKQAYIKMILSAKEFVYIQTPYFIPDDSVLDALKIACFSGVDVRIMIPNKPDHPFVYWATYSNVGELLKIGARIYIYENGFLHCKTIIADNKIASIGTANIDVRSFRLNFEVNAILYSEKVKEFTTIFNKDLEQSRELTLPEYNQRPLYIKFKESVSRLLSPIL